MTVHKLKIEPRYFAAVMNGTKPFEIRKNDRNYKVGDFLALEEWVQKDQQYTGRRTARGVTYVLSDSVFLTHGYVALGIELIGHDKSIAVLEAATAANDSKDYRP